MTEPTASTDLVTFLRARLVEDQAEIEKHPDDPFEHTGYAAERETGYPCLEILTIGKKRALAEVEAKRRIVATFAEVDAHPNRLVYAFMQQQWVALRAVVAALATPYADHPDYRQKWLT